MRSCDCCGEETDDLVRREEPDGEEIVYVCYECEDELNGVSSEDTEAEASFREWAVEFLEQERD